MIYALSICMCTFDIDSLKRSKFKFTRIFYCQYLVNGDGVKIIDIEYEALNAFSNDFLTFVFCRKQLSTNYLINVNE